MLLSSTKLITVFLYNSRREHCIIRLIMLLCEVVKLLIELAGLFYNLPGVGREGCLPCAGLGAACQLGEGSSFPGAAPQAHLLAAPSCFPLFTGCSPSGNPVPGAVGISSCLNVEIRNGSTAMAVFLLLSVYEEMTPRRFRCEDLLFFLIRLCALCNRFLTAQSWLCLH